MSEEAEVLRREALELQALLADVKSSSRELLGENAGANKGPMSEVERRGTSKSAWAKSGTKRRAPAGAMSPNTTPKGKHEAEADFGSGLFGSTRRTLHSALRCAQCKFGGPCRLDALVGWRLAVRGAV